MPPKRTFAAAAAAPMTVAAVEQLIEARVSTALANHETLRNNINGHGDESYNSNTGIEELYALHMSDVAYAMDWKTLKKTMTVKYCPRGEIKKLEIELWNLKVKGTDVASYTMFLVGITTRGSFGAAPDLPGSQEDHILAPLPERLAIRLSINPSSNPTSSTNPNPEGRNRRRSKQRIEEFNLDELSPPIVTMADQRTMAQLLQAPTEGYEDAIVFPAIIADNFELKHGLLTLFRTSSSLDMIKKTRMLIQMPRECLAIIESKSKVRYSRNKPVVTKVSTNTSTFGISLDVAELKDMVKALLLDNKSQNQSPATVKAVEEICVTCGDAHSYHNCLATDGNVYRDNIQEFVSQASTFNYNQGNTSYRPPMMSNQICPPGFPPVHNNQNVQLNQRNNQIRFIPNQNRGNNFNQGPVYQPPVFQPPAYQAPAFQALAPQTQGVSKEDFSAYVKANDAVMRNMQTQGQNMQNQLTNLTDLITKFVNSNSASTSSSGGGNEPEATKDIVNPTNNISTNDVQPPVVQSKSPILTSEPVTSPISEPVIAPKLPEKLGDPRKFLIPCDFPGMDECLALADLGASINLMPFFMWKILSLPDLTPTCMTLELAERLISRPVGVVEDVYVKVGSFYFSADFVVVDFDVGPRVPLILERSFFKTGRALIDVFEGELTLRVGKKAITFNLDQTSRYSANYSDMTAKQIDVIDMAYEENSNFLLEEVDAFLAIEDDPTSPEVDQSYLDPEGDILLLEAFLNDDPSLHLPNQGNYLPEFRKELKICEAKSDKSSIDEPSEVKLKVLPPHLEYAFLEGDDKLSVIIAKDLSVEEKTALITVLKSHKRAIAWKLSDIKGIEPEFCTHKILMKRTLNQQSNIREGPWVSPVHCVPKKGGFTVVENKDNELIPTYLVMGWRVCIDYRKLNEATRKDHFPLPFMDKMLERLVGNQYYCFLDGFSVYFQIPIDPKDQEKTTFTCPYETFAYRRMPFGLCNAPDTNSFQSRLSHLERMMKWCEDTNLCLNREKSHFMVKKGIVLGHKISKLLEKNTPFVFSKECFEAFQTLKRKLTEAPILIAPDWDMPFKLMSDASDFPIGAVLGQRQDKHFRPIHYASQNMQNQLTNITDLIMQFVNSNTTATSSPCTLPSNTIANTKIDLKAITTRSGVSYDGPQIPPPVAVQSNPVTSEPAITPVSASKPNPKASIPYPSRRNVERNREKAKDQIEKFYLIFKDMSFEISFADALILMPKFASTLKALIENKEKSFLKTGRALIEVFEGDLTIRVGKEAITFNLDQTSRYSATYNDMTAKRINVIDMACEEYSQEVLGFSDTISSEAFLNDDPSSPPLNQRNHLSKVRKELKMCKAETKKSSVNEPPVVELKALPPYLEYAFLEGDDKLPVIIAKDLSVEEKTALITVLKTHKRAIAWKLSDIKGINPEFSTHKILMEEDYTPAVQHQRRVNPKIYDVIKQEQSVCYCSRPMRFEDLYIWDLDKATWGGRVKGYGTIPVYVCEQERVYGGGLVLAGKLGNLLFSKTMTEAESNYTTTKKEMLAVVYAFEKFRSYLIMNKSIVYTDHSALKYLFAKKDSKMRLIRWVLLL
nr:DNA-directed DNA polymerase [Tanacetum cinerariifolium]